VGSLQAGLTMGEKYAMTTRETLHQLVDQLLDEQAELARAWLEDLRDATDADSPPLDAATMASLERGLADVRIALIARWSSASAPGSCNLRRIPSILASQLR
jgi:hypothetical protein